MKELFAVTGLVLAAFAPLVARADEPKAPPVTPKKSGEEPEWKVRQRRQILFDEGQRLVEHEKWSEALDRFREVDRLRPHPRVTLWMALCEEHLGNLLKARALYAQAEELAREAKLTDVEKDAARVLGELGPKVPRLALRIVPAVEAEVSIDASRVVLREGRVDVDPGKHTVEVRALRHKGYRQEISVEPGEEKVLDVTLAEDPLPMPPAPPPPSPEPGPAPGAIVALAVGGALMTTGAVFSGFGFGGSAKGFRAPGIGLLLGGAVGVGVGIPWALLSARPAPATLATPATSPKPPVSVSISAAPLPGGAALGLHGTF